MKGSHRVKKPEKIKMKKSRKSALEFAVNSVWFIVVISALALSAYSLYWIGIHYGVPQPLAIIISTCFDGAAVVAGDISLKWARTHGDSGFASRIALFMFAGASMFLNVQHGIILHDSRAACILYGAPPFIAVTVLELHTRYERRSALQRAGRVAKALPPVGKWTWIFHFSSTLQTLSLITKHRLAALEVSEIGAIDSEPKEQADYRTLYSAKIVRAWAKSNGIPIAERARIAKNIYEAYHRWTISQTSGKRLSLISGNGSNNTSNALTSENTVSESQGEGFSDPLIDTNETNGKVLP